MGDDGNPQHTAQGESRSVKGRGHQGTGTRVPAGLGESGRLSNASLVLSAGPHSASPDP